MREERCSGRTADGRELTPSSPDTDGADRCCGQECRGYGPAAVGGMAEWFKAHAWKACWGQLLAGSNPAPSAKSERLSN